MGGPRGYLRAALLALIVLLTLAGCGAADGSAGSDADAAEDAVHVPDVTGEDGQDAVDEIEREGLSASLEGTADQPSFDSGRDPSGCTVEDQDPTGGDGAQEGDEVTLTLDCREVDWENQEGDDWDRYNSSFSDGFNGGCQALFALSPDGALYDDSQSEYTSLDCTNAEPSDGSDYAPGELPDDPEAQGHDDGFEAGCNQLFEDNATSELYHGEDAFTADDCLAERRAAGANSGAGPTAPDSRGARQTCEPIKLAGDLVQIEPSRGIVRCSRAAALWAEYLRRAPHEGEGSGGFLELEGWSCISARPPEHPLLGGCDKQDRSAAFSVRAVSK